LVGETIANGPLHGQPSEPSHVTNETRRAADRRVLDRAARTVIGASRNDLSISVDIPQVIEAYPATTGVMSLSGRQRLIHDVYATSARWKWAMKLNSARRRLLE